MEAALPSNIAWRACQSPGPWAAELEPQGQSSGSARSRTPSPEPAALCSEARCALAPALSSLQRPGCRVKPVPAGPAAAHTGVWSEFPSPLGLGFPFSSLSPFSDSSAVDTLSHRHFPPYGLVQNMRVVGSYFLWGPVEELKCSHSETSLPNLSL